LFQCPNILKLKVTKKACAKLWYTGNREAFSSQNLSLSAHEYCVNCSVGKENFSLFGEKEIKQVIVAKKQCQLFQIDPTRCKNEKIDGWFYKNRKQHLSSWKGKKFCSPTCGVVYHQLKAKGLIK
jgi:hypothetical protein